jgi:hypothetical protein
VYAWEGCIYCIFYYVFLFALFELNRKEYRIIINGEEVREGVREVLLWGGW